MGTLLNNTLYGYYRRLPVWTQDVLVSMVGSRQWALSRRRSFQKIYTLLKSMETWTEEQFVQWRSQRLTGILEAASGSEYYQPLLRDAAAIRNDPFGVLRSLPVIGKSEVRANPKAFINRDYRGKLIKRGTSGTTGSPLSVYWTPETVLWERALVLRHRAYTGLDYRSKWSGMLGGYMVVPLESRSRFWRYSYLRKQIYMSTFHVSKENAGEYASVLSKKNVRYLEGYPSALYALAHSMADYRPAPRVDFVFTGSEPLRDFQRNSIEQVFGSRILEFYGLTERVASAAEIPGEEGLRVNRENCILEIVDDTGTPVKPCEKGEIVGTSLANTGFTILRYRTGDMSCFMDTDGTGQVIERIDTKREDLLTLPDGTLLSASNLTYPFKDVSHIVRSQIVQTSLDSIEVRIVPEPGYGCSDGEQLRTGLMEILPQNMKVCIRIVDDIPLTSAGKYRFCISEISD